MEPLRGEVWDVKLPQIGEHPAIVLTVHSVASRLAAVNVIVVTGTEGSPATHVSLSAEAGLTRYPVSYANVVDIHTVAKSRFRRRRGLLAAAELARIEEAFQTCLGLQE